jgi:iron complex transport system substrate-binding protein
MRICSFLPSGTEIVCALGLDDSLRAVSHECDYPAHVRSKPKIVRSRFDSATLTSAEIDRTVADLMAKGERIYEVDDTVLRDARPDLVITQQLCEVCAVSFKDVQTATLQLQTPPRIISLDPSSIGDVMTDIETIGEATETTAKAGELTRDLRGRIEAVAATDTTGGRPRRVVCIEWLDPLIVAGHWIPEMVEMAGGVDALAEPGAPSRRVSFDELAESDPDVLILMPCGMGIDKAVQELSSLTDLASWKSLRAVKQGDVFAVDSGALFSRSGPRLVDGLELLARLIRPDAFPGSVPDDMARRVTTLSG